VAAAAVAVAVAAAAAALWDYESLHSDTGCISSARNSFYC
jgi:hypothetical protein